MPWQELCAVIEPHYPKAGSGRPPIGLERMLRMYFVQHWFNLADDACEEALLDRTALRRFVGIDLGRERVPDGTTLLKFRRLLEGHKLGDQLFAVVGQVLQARGLKVGAGTIHEGEASCSALDAGRSKSTMSHHFRVLREAGLLHTQVEGTTHINALCLARVQAAFPGLLEAVVAAASTSP